jgi:hypothetical protein
VERDYIEMRVCEKMGDGGKDGLERAVGLLEELEMTLDCLSEGLRDQNKWIK